MSQHDMNIANQGFPAFRSDLNNALAALASTSAGATAPSTTFAQQLWYDSTANLLKMRNTDNDAWITLAYFDQTNDEWEVRSAVIQAVDSAGVVIKTDDGTTRIEVQDDGDVSIDSGTLFVDASENSIGINTSTPLAKLHIEGDDADILLADSSPADSREALIKARSGDLYMQAGTSLTSVSPTVDSEYIMADGGSHRWFVNGSQAMKIDSGGKVGIGINDPDGLLHLSANTDNSFPSIVFQDSGTTSTRLGIITNSSGDLVMSATSGITDQKATIALRDDSSMRFYTSSSTAERMRIDSDGNVLFATTDDTVFNNTSGFGSKLGGDGRFDTARDVSPAMVVNLTENDGDLIQLRQAGTTEGVISVSGSTVSYNGGHLARYSQAIDGSRIDGLVKGTVLSNLNEMCEWKRVEFDYQHLVSEAVEAQDEVLDEEGNVVREAVEAQDAVYETITKSDSYGGDANSGDVIDWEYKGETYQATVIFEDNEQLNRMKVSDVEGDPNVAGVFVNWDDDDEVNTADMNIAMTGDMVIRIAQGTTVARGDLLMSAGDGTAKPQGDDIVRSKTIAKVTSTHVSHTYDDGSYLVPCVLMAC